MYIYCITLQSIWTQVMSKGSHSIFLLFIFLFYSNSPTRQRHSALCQHVELLGVAPDFRISFKTRGCVKKDSIAAWFKLPCPYTYNMYDKFEYKFYIHIKK